jgi:hypothetical protein
MSGKIAINKEENALFKHFTPYMREFFLTTNIITVLGVVMG